MPCFEVSTSFIKESLEKLYNNLYNNLYAKQHKIIDDAIHIEIIEQPPLLIPTMPPQSKTKSKHSRLYEFSIFKRF